jgi:hypothetical protein
LTYLIKNPHRTSGKTRAHIWIVQVQDTACRMYSTGGLRRLSQFKVVEDCKGIPICLMCRNVVSRKPKQRTGRVLWTETKIIDT